MSSIGIHGGEAVEITGTPSVDVTDDATRDLGKVDVASLDQYTPASGRLPVDGSGVTQPVSAASLPLPTDAATQTTLASLLTELQGKADTAENQATKEIRSGTSAVTAVADNAASVELLAANSNRLGASITNDSSAVLYVKLGTTASTTSYTVQIPQNALYEIPFGYTGKIDGIWATDPGDGSARITELSA